MESTMSTSSSTRTFDVPELFENIISFIPERDILTSVQRVSQTWKASVDASPRLQRKTWQRKGKEPAVSPTRLTVRSENDDVLRSRTQGGVPVYSMPISVNSLFTNTQHLLTEVGVLGVDCNTPLRSCFTLYSLYVRIRYRTDFPDAKREMANQRWRSMQICDPPITLGKMDIRMLLGLDGNINFPRMISDEGGITMGLLYDTGIAAISSNPSGNDKHGNVNLGDPSCCHWDFGLNFWVKTGSEEDDGEDDDGEGDGDGDSDEEDDSDEEVEDGREKLDYGDENDE